jgi:hypothetical protein
VKKPTRPKNAAAHKADKQQFLAAMIRKYGKVDSGSLTYRDGYWYLTVWDKNAHHGKGTWVEVRAKAKA